MLLAAAAFSASRFCARVCVLHAPDEKVRDCSFSSGVPLTLLELPDDELDDVASFLFRLTGTACVCVCRAAAGGVSTAALADACRVGARRVDDAGGGALSARLFFDDVGLVTAFARDIVTARVLVK